MTKPRSPEGNTPLMQAPVQVSGWGRAPASGSRSIQFGRSLMSSLRSSALLAFVISYIVSRGIFAAAGFRYDIFEEPFSIGKLLIDFGVWCIVYGISYVLLERARGRKSPKSTPQAGHRAD